MNSARKVVQVGGMTCSACVRRVEEGLKNLEGVLDASVNIATSKATIDYDPGVATEEAIRKKIEEIGYEPARSGAGIPRDTGKGDPAGRGHDLRRMRASGGDGAQGRIRGRRRIGQPGIVPCDGAVRSRARGRRNAREGRRRGRIRIPGAARGDPDGPA